ncbi:MAG: hypothetical protein DWI21_03940 [Planctomycetota bacterium]|nr:MAG: hypothetical protein DWI21_03940 [Planctomycetota bacterium]
MERGDYVDAFDALVRNLCLSGLIVSSVRRVVRTGCQTRTTASTGLTVNSVAARHANAGILRLVQQNEARTIL